MIDILEFRQALSDLIVVPTEVNKTTSLPELPQSPENEFTHRSHSRLVASWEVENGKLVCKWLVNRER
ncbi:MAG: hypothetical protein HC769_01900 [Cyanobacteria bacterium CRU_2_1]|nr:hypothetical protein [Cyanobacteria bacterium RU_5_0]NJR57711.1 hypothetical protein [Cyanobacteria bacterium CRU_2_1]